MLISPPLPPLPGKDTRTKLLLPLNQSTAAVVAGFCAAVAGAAAPYDHLASKGEGRKPRFISRGAGRSGISTYSLARPSLFPAPPWLLPAPSFHLSLVQPPWMLFSMTLALPLLTVSGGQTHPCLRWEVLRWHLLMSPLFCSTVMAPSTLQEREHSLSSACIF